VLDTQDYSAIGEQAQDYYDSKGMDSTQWRNVVKVTALECRSREGNPKIPIYPPVVSFFDWQGTVSTPPFATVPDASNNQSVLPTEPPPAILQETIPPGAIQLPNFVGKPFDEAVAWLKQNGFKHMWVDGKSTYDVGVVYNQQPAAGKYKVPHRTTVVLYRTIEKSACPLVLEYEGESTQIGGKYTCAVPWAQKASLIVDCNGNISGTMNVGQGFKIDDVSGVMPNIFVEDIWLQDNHPPNHIIVEAVLSEDYLTLKGKTIYYQEKYGTLDNPACIWGFELNKK
jgi:hypothetical protein